MLLPILGWELAELAEGLAGMLAGRGQRWEQDRRLRSLCALLLSFGFRSFIAGRPVPALCQHFHLEPCSASLPASAPGSIRLPFTLGEAAALKSVDPEPWKSHGSGQRITIVSLVCNSFSRAVPFAIHRNMKLERLCCLVDRAGSQETSGLFLTLPLTSCVALGKSLPRSVCLFLSCICSL